MVEVKTILKADLMRKFNAEQTKSKIWLPTVLMFVFLVCGVVALLMDWGTLISLVLIIVGVLLPLIYVLTARFLMERVLKGAQSLQSETTQIWRFLENNILFNESGKYTQACDTQISYDAIYKVVERESAFYLFTAKTQAYILDAKGITIGSRKELHDLLINRIGAKKYKYSKRLYAK